MADATKDPQATSVATVEAVWRIEAARLIATLARLTGDVGLAEDMAQDALVTALEQWPQTGVPENPAGWLYTTARNRGIDRVRRERVLDGKYERVARELERQPPEPGPESILEEERIGDDVLTLVFTACHPALTRDSQVALTLKAVAGLSTGAIARGFLVSEATISQRIVRAKRSLESSGARFEQPDEQEMGERLEAVLGVIYLIFNEGYAASAGDSWLRTDLAAEALRLGRVVAGLAPAEPEVHGLVSLMEIQASRFPARVDAEGEPVLLLEQDRSRWDRLLVRRGLERLELADNLGGRGPYVRQAAIAACHARAASAEETDWDEIVRQYDELIALGDSPVARLNRAVAVGMAGEPGSALRSVEELADDRRLNGYPHVHAVRGELLERLGRREEAAAAFGEAARLTSNERERGVLESRATRSKEISR